MKCYGIWLTDRTVLPPIETKNLTSADVDHLTQSTRDSMLKTLADMSNTQERKVDASRANGVSSSVEI